MASTRWDATIPTLQAETGMVNGEVAMLAGAATAGDGGGGAVTFSTSIPAARTVVTPGATNAIPIEITTSGAHLFVSGQRVLVANVKGNTAANGTWTITVTSSTKFTLNGSTGNGAWTSGGAVGDGGLTIPSASTTIGMWTRIL
jgi:hypothetical protein